MKIVITENQLRSIIKTDIEEEYPESWSIEDFKKIKSFNGRVKYCEQRLQRISSGSSRIVYKIDDVKVLKLAKNQKGIAQNGIEIGFSNDYLWDGMVAEIFEYDENDLWVEMELARKVTPTIWNNLIGIPIDVLESGMRYIDNQKNYSKNRLNPKPQRMDELWDNEFTSNLLDLVGNYDIGFSDLGKLSSYGVVKRDGEDTIVIIDYGLTNDVYKTHYKKR